MAAVEILVISGLRAIVEVAMFALVGQGALALLAGERRADNLVYRLFCIITAPAIAVARYVTPAFLLGRHLPYWTFFLLFSIWVALAWLKHSF